MKIETEELKAAILNARAARLNAEVAGMVAENQQRLANGLSIAYDNAAFEYASRNSGLEHDDVIRLIISGDA